MWGVLGLLFSLRATPKCAFCEVCERKGWLVRQEKIDLPTLALTLFVWSQNKPSPNFFLFKHLSCQKKVQYIFDRSYSHISDLISPSRLLQVNIKGKLGPQANQMSNSSSLGIATQWN